MGIPVVEPGADRVGQFPLRRALMVSIAHPALMARPDVSNPGVLWRS
jgi:hypothetical protein